MYVAISLCAEKLKRDKDERERCPLFFLVFLSAECRRGRERERDDKTRVEREGSDIFYHTSLSNYTEEREKFRER